MTRARIGLLILVLLTTPAIAGEPVIGGTVVDGDGAAVAGAEVQLAAWKLKGETFWRSFNSPKAPPPVRSGSDGTFQLVSPSGVVEVLMGCRAKGHAAMVTDPIRLPRTEPLNLTLSPGVSLTVRVIDSITHRPVPKARIEVSPRHRGNEPHVFLKFPWLFGNPRGTLSLTADQAGRAVHPDCPSGAFCGSAKAEGYEFPERHSLVSSSRVVRFPDTRELVIEVQPDAVIDDDGKPLPPLAIARLGIRRWTRNPQIAALAFATDGSVLVVGRGRAMTVLAPETGVSAGLLAMSGKKVRGVAVSQDGARAASVSEDGMLNVGHPDSPSSAPRFQMRLSEKPLFAVAFTPDGQTAVVGGDDGVVRRCDLDEKKVTGSQDLERGPVTGLAALPDGTIAVTAGSDVLLLGGKTRELGSVGPLALCLAASPDGRLVAAGAWGKAFVWEVATGEIQQTIECEGGVLTLAFGPAGKTIAIGTSEGRIRFYRGGKLAWDRPGNSQEVRALAVSRDGKRILAGGGSPGIRIYSDDGREIATPPGHFRSVFFVDHSPVAPIVASAGLDGMVLLWDLKERKLLHRIHAHSGPVHKVKFTADGRHVISTAGDGSERIWVVTTGRPGAADDVPDAAAAARPIPPELAPMIKRMLMGDSRTMTISPDGRTLVTGNSDGSLVLWDLTRLTD